MAEYVFIASARQGGSLLRKKLLCGLVALAILLTIPVVIGNASVITQRHAGVKVGDMAEYTMTLWYANRFTLLVTKVEGSHVYFNGTYYHNGTLRETHEFSFDVSDLGDNSMLRFLVAANLVAGDPILTYDNVTLSINQTITKKVAGSLRSVNHAEYIPLGILPQDDIFVTDQPYGYDMYWDQETGIIVEAHIVTMVGWDNWTLVSTNMFRYITINTLPLIVAGGSVVAVAIIVDRRRRA